MKLRVQVQQVWQKQSRRERRIVRSYVRGSPDAGLRLRCKVVLALVQGNSSAALIRSRMASASLVYEVMHRFIDQAVLGLADRREDNGEPKVAEQYEAHVCPWKRPRKMRRLRAIRRLIQSVPNNELIKETYHGLKKRNRTLQRHYAQKQAA